jgi:predicted membrane protein DUF2079
MTALLARVAGRAGPIVMTGLILLFTITCGRWMIALHDTAHTAKPQDVASLSQAIWNTSKGRFARETILYEGVRDHLEPVILVYALNYVAAGTLRTLLYLHALVIGLGAVPFYALARQRGLATLDAWLIGLSYLLLPPLHRLIEKDYFRTDVLLFPALALLAYAVTARRDRLTLAAAALALCVRESAALPLMGLGIYQLWVERRVRWGVTFLALGALWIPFVNWMWLPWLNHHATLHTAQLRSPVLIVEELAALWAVRWPVGVLAVTALLLLRNRWAALLTVPSLLALPFFRMDLRYSAPLFSVVWMGIADEITRWSGPRARRATLIAACCLFAVANVALRSWRQPEDRLREVRPLLGQLPPDVAVCAEGRVLGLLSTRERLYQFDRQAYFPEDARACLDAEYFLLNRHGRETLAIEHLRHPDRSQALREVEALGVETMAESGTWVLWRRRS